MGAGMYFQDCEKSSVLFEGATEDKDGNYTVYTNSCISERLEKGIERASIMLEKQPNSTYRIRMNNNPGKLGYLIVGHDTDPEGDHVVYTSYAGGDSVKKGFQTRTLWRLIPVGNQKYQIQNVYYGAYLFAGHAVDDNGDHQLFAGTRMANDKRSHFEIFEDGYKTSL